MKKINKKDRETTIVTVLLFLIAAQAVIFLFYENLFCYAFLLSIQCIIAIGIFNMKKYLGEKNV